jgi:hypothetical protein
MIYDDELLSRLKGWDDALDQHWARWRKDARLWFGMVAGDQWDTADRDRLQDENRVPVTFNRTGPIIDAVCGAEIVGRQQVQYLPREVGDTGVNEVLTRGAEWFRDRAGAEFEESDAFRDAFICGLGWIETRMDYEEEAEGRILVDRVDPLEVAADPAARKPNLVDARYIRRTKLMSEAEFEARWPGAAAFGPSDGKVGGRAINRGHRYQDYAADGEVMGADEVAVKEFQWFDRVTVHLVEDPMTGAITELSDDALQEAQALADAEGAPLQSVRQARRRYRRAYLSGEALLEVEDLPDGEFTLKAVTGKRDRNKGVWYGLVRAMVDPQRWANKFFSQILHILNTNAKGGIMAPVDAFDDPKEAERTWAQADAITWINEGMADTVRPKPIGGYPQGLDRLMEVAVASIRDTSGVNQELLGLVERNQPGVLEHQRKQAAYGILAAFFDSFRRYRQLQGALMLKYIQKYVPAGTLVRIIGDDGTARYVPLAKAPETAAFDVVVDEAPGGPNQKALVWSLVMQLPPAIQQQLTPEIWAELIRYSPLPDSLVQKLNQASAGAAEPKQAAQAMAQRAAAAKIARDEAAAARDAAEAAMRQAEARAAEAQAMAAAFAAQRG